MPVEIPFSGEQNTEQETTLDGVPYTLRFYLNTREDRWYMSIRDQSGNPLVSGIKIITGWSLLWQYGDSRLPVGQIVCVDPSVLAKPLPQNVSLEPTGATLGSVFKLFYYTLDELTEAGL